ncbi:uncharacterized protein [Diadema antillarum]|uniref:uncharacterized protein n=1 Tax=Diadema antillarum TaxID=105358 RepID=UPI003A8BFC4B
MHSVVLLLIIYIAQTEAFTRLAIPQYARNEWQQRNNELKELIAPIHRDLNHRILTPKEAADSFSHTVFGYFASQPDFVQENNSRAYVEHEPKTLADARKKKNILRRKAFGKESTEEDRKNFRSAVKAVSFLKKRSDKRKAGKTAAYQENLYRKDFWNFSKQVCNGDFNKAAPNISFSKETADEYYPQRYSRAEHIDFNQLQWFPYINVDERNYEFDLTPVTPKQVKLVLQAKKASSSPGPDGLMYGLLRNTPCVHHFLATLFSQLLLETNDPPESWSCCQVTLIHKAGDTNVPENFRMISLTSCVSKIFHQILANRLACYLTTNCFIDPSVQKAFINGVNGCVEHNQVLHEIIAHSKAKKRTVHLTFFDLADAFGSVSHELISHSLHRFHVPTNLSVYIDNLYGRLQVHTLQKTHLDKLDVMTDKYLKKWLGVPARGANIAIVHLPHGLNIPSLSDIYRQSQSLAFTRSRVKADSVVNQAIDSAIERESNWARNSPLL